MRFIASLLVLVAFAAFSHSAEPGRPNIVLIMADDFGYECVRANGGTSYQTPNLDKLAATGVRFTHAFAQPLCTPSRVQIMTGKYNFRNYVKFGAFDFHERSFAHVLKDAGYTSSIVGKWQLGGDAKAPYTLGFDDYCLWQILGRGERYAVPEIIRNGEKMVGLEKAYGPDVFLDHAKGFISANKAKPFFLYWPEVLTHSPYEPTPDSKEWGTVKAAPKHFPEMVNYLDKVVGKLVDHLEKEGVRENTLIVFTGDNGTGAGTPSVLNGKNVVGAKGRTVTLGHHVPLIANWPAKAKAGTVCGDIVDFTDVLPTLAAAGAATLKIEKLDGRSFLPQVLGEKGQPREWGFSHYEPRQGNKGPKTRFAWDHRWKLYQDGRLYDMIADENETSPIDAGSESAEAKAARAKLQAVIDRYEKEKPFAE